MVNAIWMAARPQWYLASSGSTNKVQPYWRLAIIVMQTMPRKSCPHRPARRNPALVGGAAAVAIAAAGVRPLTYEGLRDQVGRTIDALNGFGVGREDRVAIVLPNGPEMALAFVATAAGATAAPLNPGYRSEEFEFYLSDL